MSLLKFLGRILVIFATMTFIAGISLFVVGSYLLTWPLLRLSPRDRKVQALVNAATAGFGLLTVVAKEQHDELQDSDT